MTARDLQDSRFEATLRLHRESICLLEPPIWLAYRVKKPSVGASPVLRSGSSSVITVRVVPRSRGNETHQLIACVPKLEISSRRCELINKLVDCAAKPRMFVSLEVCLQIILSETFVDL